jgi:deazaflavin-dependent oxidoreductase (nitroreductase family)
MRRTDPGLVGGVTNWNTQIIEEFRHNHGRVGGHFEGAPLLLLTTAGRRTRQPHTSPMMYLADGDRLLVFASKGGAPTHPDWYHNLLADPHVTVEVGDDSYQAHAVVLEGEERERFYAEQAVRYPQFGEYQKRTSRVIPVVALVADGA